MARLTEEELGAIRASMIGPVASKLLAELDEVTRERDEARRIAGDLFVAIWPIDRPGTPPKNLTDAFERWQAGAATKPEGAPALSATRLQEMARISPDTYPFEDLFGPPDDCRHCGGALLVENRRIADGCPCNSPRGINHGLVAKNTCTCLECDPAQTGSTRISGDSTGGNGE